MNILSRSNTSLSGSEFAQQILNMPAGQQREDVIFKEFENYNIPSWLKDNLVEITTSDNNNVLKYYVIPDVLCIGSDDDFLRVSITGITGRKIADLYNCVMPTKKMCDQIWNAADLKLNPQPWGPPYNEEMLTTKRFIDHNALIEKQRNGRNFKLISGHKKDTVICKGLLSHPENTSIYGWFKTNGVAIQGPNYNCTSHMSEYTDYSQAIRLIDRNIVVNNQNYDFYDVINDQNLSDLISDEGFYDAKNIYK